MKILIVSPRSAPLLGGVESHVQNLAKALLAQGCKVTVVTQKVKEDNLPDVKVLDGVEYLYFDAGLNSYDGVSIKLVKHVENVAKNFDIIHLQALHKPLSLWVLAKLRKLNVPVVFTPHYHGTGHTPAAVMAHKIYQPLVKKYIHYCSKVIAVSDVEKAILDEHFPQIISKTVVIPNGVIPVKTVPAFDKTKPVILSVGRLEPYKRVDEIITSLPEDTLLVIVGEGSDKERLTKLAETLEKSKNVLFTGKISDDELAKWWNTADLFVSLSEQEAFGLTLGESITVGVPSLVSNIPAHKYVAKLANSEDLVTMVDPEILLNEQMKQKLADKTVKSRRSFYSWEQAASKTIEVYSSVRRKK